MDLNSETFFCLLFVPHVWLAVDTSERLIGDFELTAQGWFRV